MITTVFNVKSIILLNGEGVRSSFSFKKIIFSQENCYLAFEHQEEVYAYKLSIIDEKVFLDPIDDNDNCKISKLLSLCIKQCDQRHWAVGISYNETSSANSISTRFKISNHDQPLDILPFLLQTGANSIEISP
ncbi:hypothetical protein P5G65_23740 [Paenibacillus chondroitinus]|uniref:Uncharacterized protein n=1 Tax=Paenibacillus chondroitinus TaxID=59842 RepID=A0ABU6DGM9_9BACL|nr:MULTISPECIES: hypothetical protein [Paenibacillus]MCY9659522.1 hypothetical protein [Paenibacillus anseongense]MEB4796917.1 hypothetical protein [Paenibacillus chondroitinus]